MEFALISRSFRKSTLERGVWEKMLIGSNNENKTVSGVESMMEYLRGKISYQNFFRKNKFRLFQMNGHSGAVSAIRVGSRDHIYSASVTGEVGFWDLKRMKGYLYKGHVIDVN